MAKTNAERCATYYAKHPERQREKKKKQYRNNPEKAKDRSRRSALFRKYGISVEEYDNRLVEQNGVCFICRQPEKADWKGAHRKLSVDHCHKTNTVRKLLCKACNTSLGAMGEDPLRLRAAADYLERHAA